MKRFTYELKRMTWLMLLLVCVQGTTVAQNIGDTFTADKLKYCVLNKQEVEVCGHVDDRWDATGEVIIPETVEAAEWNRNYTVTTIGNYAFYGRSGLTEINIPNSVTTIESEAFRDCSGLRAINIPNSVTTIGKGAFACCSGLTAINIPNSVTTIGSTAFYGCSRLTTINIPNSVTTIESHAFHGCSGLTAINIPNSVTTIGEGAFYGCSGLTALTVNADNAHFSSSEGVLLDKSQQKLIQCPAGKKGEYKIPNSVTKIGEYAFGGCSGLTDINIPNSVTTIGEYAFIGCSGLTDINIPNSVTTIGEYAFGDCSGLTAINIPNSVTTIGNRAFSFCGRLTSINIGNSVTSIGNEAFYYCRELTSINIPNSVTTIGNEAFYNCSGLETLYFHSINPPTTTRDCFEGCYNIQTIYVPQEAVATYQATEPYNEYNIQGMDETTGIGEVETTEMPQSDNIYDLNGRLVRTDGNLQALPKGIYILNGKKVVR